MQAVYDHFRKNGSWPTLAAIARPLRRDHDIDAAGVIAEFPGTLMIPPRQGLRPVDSDQIRPTLAGIGQAPRGDPPLPCRHGAFPGVQDLQTRRGVPMPSLPLRLGDSAWPNLAGLPLQRRISRNALLLSLVPPKRAAAKTLTSKKVPTAVTTRTILSACGYIAVLRPVAAPRAVIIRPARGLAGRLGAMVPPCDRHGSLAAPRQLTPGLTALHCFSLACKQSPVDSLK